MRANAPPDAVNKPRRRWNDARRVHDTRSPQRQDASLRLPANADDDPASPVSTSRKKVARLFATLSPLATLASVSGPARGRSPSRNARLADALGLTHALVAFFTASCHDLNTASAPQNGSASTRLERGESSDPVAFFALARSPTSVFKRYGVATKPGMAFHSGAMHRFGVSRSSSARALRARSSCTRTHSTLAERAPMDFHMAT